MTEPKPQYIEQQQAPGDFTELMEQVMGMIGTALITEIAPANLPDPNDLEGALSSLIVHYISGRIQIALEQGRREAGQHVYQHQARDAEPLINTTVERNSRGFNWSCSIIGARNLEEDLRLTDEVMASLARVYGQQNAELAASKPVKASKSRPEVPEPEEL
jgi:hypothetical protein